MEQSLRGLQALVADIGGTNARFGLADLDTLQLTAVEQFVCSDYGTLSDIIVHYVAGLGLQPRLAAIAVAAPGVGHEIRLTNSHWRFTETDLCRAAGISEVLILNDFEALALALPYLSGNELYQIGGGKPDPSATKLVLGPGTGLGVAGLVWGGSGWVAIPTEGGHISIPLRGSREYAVANVLQSTRPHLSVESLVSGPGLSRLYQAIAKLENAKVEAIAPNDVLMRGMERSDAFAAEALTLFVTLFARFAGDAALLFGARGGVFIGGGIAPKLVNMLSQGSFRDAFEEKGQMRSFLAPIPIYVILAEFATLRGASVSLRQNRSKAAKID
jgi:glucokinase